MTCAVALLNMIKASQNFMNAFNSLNPANFNVKHIDGSALSVQRSSALHWLASSRDDCRILSNASCLSEGVDVPALDAVIFLNPRSSEIDVVQSDGRVMRKAQRKKYGYVILPVIVHEKEIPEYALDHNESYRTVWKVLQALRAHDDHFNAVIKSLGFGKTSKKVRVTGNFSQDNANISWFNEDLAEKYRSQIYVRMV